MGEIVLCLHVLIVLVLPNSIDMSLFPLRKPEVFLSILNCFGFKGSLNIVLLLDEGLSFHLHFRLQLLLQLIVKYGRLTQIALPSVGFIF